MPTIPATPAGFRRHQLDGAMLYFQPQTGIHLRVQNAATRDCVRQAPRAVMMGITNLCNLQCDFCSRDIAARSLWTVDSAFELLHGLYAAGTLEVAFGGGEPLLFKGFAELVQRLQAHTDLALNLTTNGSRVSHELWQSLQGGIRMARLSIYPETDIARIAAVWQAQKQRWGANVLVDDAALATLPQLLEELAARGAQDVSILTYVGEPARLLSASGRERLQAIIQQAPLPCRLSVCAGDMGLSTFSAGFVTADCGAGHDFISISADQHMQACSFAAERWPAANAEQALHAWRRQQATLRQPSPRSGCARKTVPIVLQPEVDMAPSVHVWQSFSGNNSGECVMVAQFESTDLARQWAEQLLPGWQPEEIWSEEWLQLLDAAQVARPVCSDRGRPYLDMPEHLALLGRSVIATAYGLGDELAPLEQLAWRNQAESVHTLNHIHGDVQLLALARAPNAQQAQAVADTLKQATHPETHIWSRQQHVLVLANLANITADARALAARKAQLEHAFSGLPWVCDVVDIQSPEPLLEALKHYRPDIPRHTRLAAYFTGEGARQSAEELLRQWDRHGTAYWVGSTGLASHVVLKSIGERPRRLAVLAARAGAVLDWTYGKTVLLRAYLAPPPDLRARQQKKGSKTPKPVPPNYPAFADELRQRLNLQRDAVSLNRPDWPGASYTYLHVRTGRPEAIAPTVLALAEERGLECSLSLQDIRPLHWVYDRLLRAL